MIRNIKHIQIKRVAYSPKLYQAVLTYTHPGEYDESDEIELQKTRDEHRKMEKSFREPCDAFKFWDYNLHQ